MIASVSLRLSAAAFVVLTLPVLTPVAGQCAGQEAGRGVDGAGVFPRADDAQQAAELRAGVRVLAARVCAVPLVLRDPDEAYQHVKQVRDAIRDDLDLSEPYREWLELHLEWTLYGVLKCGTVVKQQQQEWLALKAELRARLDRWRVQLER